MSEDVSLEDQLKVMIVERLFLDKKGIRPSDIGEEDELMDKFGVDSVMIFEIVIGLEEELGVVFDEDDFDIEKFKTVKSIAESVREKQAG